MRFTGEEYIELMTYGDVNRQMFVELFGPLIGLEDEWRSQGASEDEVNLTAFDFDYVDQVLCGGNTDVYGGIVPHIMEENDRFIISIDEMGKRTKLMKGIATLPLPLDYPVTDMDSWLKIKHWFTYDEGRIDWDMVQASKKAQAQGSIVLAGIPGGFDLPRQLMGEENVCMCYYDNPELMQDIMDTALDTNLQVLGRISDVLTIDNLCVHEDMAGKSGSLIGPNLIEKYVKPYYKGVWDMLSSKGTKLFTQDSDGNMNSVLDVFMESGINVTYPAEPGSFMDIVSLRNKYGKELAYKGGLDKYVLRKGRDAIRDELEYKMQPIMQQGGNVFGLDHRIPNGTHIADYRYYVNTAREILHLPSIGNNKGWERMAF